MRRVYMDHAATTPVRPEVFEQMRPYFLEEFGNPSSIYASGRRARRALDQAREMVAEAIGAHPAEIIFTGSGSEADNLAIKGVAWKLKNKGNHIITSSIEHHAVLDTVKWLEKNGFETTYLPVDSEGRVPVEAVREAISDRTILISVMHGNNEVGSIQPIEEIGELAKEKGIFFHTDAVQTVGSLPIDVDKLNVDMLSMSAHKMYGPKGVGALYLRKGVRLEQLIHGGGQENRRRAGTENVAGIVGLAYALHYAEKEREEVIPRLQRLRDQMIAEITKIPDTRLNGSREHRLPNNVNVCFKFIEGESLLLNLDMKGIEASSGSACTSGSLDPSHVLLAMGLSHEVAHGSLRLTLGRETTEEDVRYVVSELPPIVEKLRAMSPLFNK